MNADKFSIHLPQKRLAKVMVPSRCSTMDAAFSDSVSSPIRMAREVRLTDVLFFGSSWDRVGDFGVENPRKLGIARGLCILARRGIRHP